MSGDPRVTKLPLQSDAEGQRMQQYPPPEAWDDWTEWDPAEWPRKVPRRYMLVPTVCFNCESACGLLGWVDRETLEVRKFEGNPAHPGSRGRNCAKGPATLNQVNDPDRILYPLKRAGTPRRGPVGARCLGGGARRHRRAHPVARSPRDATTRSCTTSAGPATTA